ncbi:hypothetical protein DFH07DRAFT_954828 [Mycena maculata]|uniref:Uncharacterized protein n=1 Tax=Mycena maculata TaxID=230809 RepID=A0AAD7NMS5_9AGAR|nr:hypothetical protein DFH07DRAFT_954828 [Mycena maculata]
MLPLLTSSQVPTVGRLEQVHDAELPRAEFAWGRNESTNSRGGMPREYGGRDTTRCVGCVGCVGAKDEDGLFPAGRARHWDDDGLDADAEGDVLDGSAKGKVMLLDDVLRLGRLEGAQALPLGITISRAAARGRVATPPSIIARVSVSLILCLSASSLPVLLCTRTHTHTPCTDSRPTGQSASAAALIAVVLLHEGYRVDDENATRLDAEDALDGGRRSRGVGVWGMGGDDALAGNSPARR